MYIRTKDGVYENANPYFIEDNKLYMGWDYPADIEADFLGDIIAQSESLEELCDEFVIVLENADGQKIYSINYALCEAIKDKDLMIKVVSNKDLKYEFNIYGAVWTDKGLIYVAKMNESGDLELI